LNFSKLSSFDFFCGAFVWFVYQQGEIKVMITPSPSSDIPFTIQGYVTDPKLVGYQLLTNYEGTYWRALVGNDAWSLYEVLRSFCHHGSSDCHPSINLLMAILSIKERRLLTGRSTSVNGIDYHYPGLIDILQKHGLMIAEQEGEGPYMRYFFHVNLTPPLLTADQVLALPELLQKKHAELLVRCEEVLQQLKAKQRPSKIPIARAAGGSGNLPEGSGNLPGGSGNLPVEQYPINNTQKTKKSARSKDTNNNSDLPAEKQAIVVALATQGITGKIAQQLAKRFSKERIEQKLTYLEFLQEEQPTKVQNPRGWLRRAIEEDYGPPDGFLSLAEREQRQKEEASAQTQVTALLQETEQLQKEKREAATAAQETLLQQIRDQYGTTDEDRILWQQTKSDLNSMRRPAIYDLIADAEILHCTAETALIGIPNASHLRQLTHPRTQMVIGRALMQVAGRPLVPQFVPLQEKGEPGGRALGDSGDTRYND
jgi:hypothetical protein